MSSLGRAGEVKTELAILEDRARSLREAMLAATINKVQEIEVLLYSIDRERLRLWHNSAPRLITHRT